jgi:hypothetical protein
MLNLQSLLEKRATELTQSSSDWHKAVWSPEFQRLTSMMTDGEVESLFAICGSSEQLTKLTHSLLQVCETSEQSPVEVLQSLATAKGLSINDWVRQLK